MRFSEGRIFLLLIKSLAVILGIMTFVVSTKIFILVADQTTNTSGTVLLDDSPEGIPDIDGSAYILYDAQSDTFLVGSNCDTPLPPASITKVLTILLALENLELTDVITVTKDMYDFIPGDYVRLGIVEGEEITVIDAIYASLLISANDACSALAVKMAGSIEGFSVMMNERAAQLGCTGTNFTNPFGYADPEHVTTVHDMALIMEAALEFDLFKEISTTSAYSISPTNKFNAARTITNGNKFISNATYSYEHYIAGKTGETDLSGFCIVAAAESDGRVLIGVILGASTRTIRYSNLIDLFDYGFSNYTTTSNGIDEYTTLQAQICTQINEKIIASGLIIANTEITLQPYITTSAERSSGGYSTTIDLSRAVIDATLDSQILELPVTRQYSDGTIFQVGTMRVTVTKELMTEQLPDKKENSSKDTQLWINRVVIILILLIVLTVAIMIFLQVQQRRRIKMNRRKPRIL
jgi:D-alanyl-D-alanine carboxypeptidase